MAAFHPPKWPRFPPRSTALCIGEQGKKFVEHTTLATARLRFLFLAAKMWRHAGRVGVSYSDHYAEQGIFRRLMDRLREITKDGQRFRPVLVTALRE